MYDLDRINNNLQNNLEKMEIEKAKEISDLIIKKQDL